RVRAERNPIEPGTRGSAQFSRRPAPARPAGIGLQGDPAPARAGPGDATPAPAPPAGLRSRYRAGPAAARPEAGSAAGAGVVLGDDLLRDPAPVRDLLVPAAGPLADRPVLRPIHRLRGAAPGRGARPSSTDPGAGIHIR